MTKWNNHQYIKDIYTYAISAISSLRSLKCISQKTVAFPPFLHLFVLKKQDAYIAVWHTTVEPDTQGTLVHWQWPTHKYNGKDYKLSKPKS